MASIPSGGAYGGGYSNSDDYNVGVSYGGQYGRGGDTFKDKPLRSRRNAFLELAKLYAKEPIAWATIAAALFFMLTIHYRGQRNWILRSFQVPSTRNLFDTFLDSTGTPKPCPDELSSSHHGSHHAADHDLHNQIANLEHEVTLLEKEKNAYKKKNANVEEKHEKIEQLSNRDYAWKDQVEVLQNATQRESRRAATEL
jgi:hypothetical protein